MSDKNIIRAYEEALPIALLRTREAVMARFRPLLSEHGLTDQQWRVIRVVQGQNEVDATSLAEHCCILMPSLSRMLKSLEKDGVLERTKLNKDRRRQLIKLTSKGEKIFDSMAPKSEKVYAKIEAEYGTQEIRKLVLSLADLQKTLEK
ncbi:MAG: homoprotocatechuate degradation operon regulator HpaR [Rhizobiaceae bacterium]